MIRKLPPPCTIWPGKTLSGKLPFLRPFYKANLHTKTQSSQNKILDRKLKLHKNQHYLITNFYKPQNNLIKCFHSISFLKTNKQMLLADVGEGIRECEIIQWFVKPGDLIEEFDDICEFQSDKASDKVTSRYAGKVTKLHCEPGQIILVGKPLVDIETKDDVQETISSIEVKKTNIVEPVVVKHSNLYSSLATPAVRRVCKEHNLDINLIPGSGKQGRVMKEDVYKFIASKDSLNSNLNTNNNLLGQSTEQIINSSEENVNNDEISNLTPIQSQMFSSMTRSLSIPHFLYTDALHIDNLINLRKNINNMLSKNQANNKNLITKISYMPFFIKALSIIINEFPILNSKIIYDNQNNSSENKEKPKLMLRKSHNIGVAISTPKGLIVPNIKNVQNLTIYEIAQELKRLIDLQGTFSSSDLKETTITLSNIGNIGGTYLAPVISSDQVCILGLGKIHKIPTFASSGEVVPAMSLNMSWSGDHRVIDGMTMALAAERWKELIENPTNMLINMK